MADSPKLFELFVISEGEQLAIIFKCYQCTQGWKAAYDDPSELKEALSHLVRTASPECPHAKALVAL